MPIQAIEPRRLYQQIADQLRTLIQAGEFAVGARLPAERDLAVQLGVSRPSVREALIALEVEGLVEVRIGSGVYVMAKESARQRSVEGAHGPLEIIRARQLLEGELAALAAISLDPGLAGDLHEAVQAMEDDIAAQRVPIRGDRLFHLRIAQASENSALLAVVTQWFDERNEPLFAQFGSHFEHESSWADAVAEHREVLAAIAQRDPVRARLAMSAHLQRSHDRFSVGFTAAPRRLTPRSPIHSPQPLSGDLP